MIERFLTQTHFVSEADYNEHLHFKIPEDFNFAYDVMDAWAEEAPDKLALLWTSERGEEIRFTFADIKEQTDRTAAYFQQLGIGHDDKVMLILKRHYQWWLSMLALHKLGAVAIPATHMLTAHDIVYRNQRASTSRWPTRAGARPYGVRCTVSGLPGRPYSCTTTRSLPLPRL